MPDRFHLFAPMFWVAAAHRALRTAAQSFLSITSTAVVLTDINWAHVGSATILAGLLSVVMAVATDLPEAADG